MYVYLEIIKISQGQLVASFCFGDMLHVCLNTHSIDIVTGVSFVNRDFARGSYMQFPSSTCSAHPPSHSKTIFMTWLLQL